MKTILWAQISANGIYAIPTNGYPYRKEVFDDASAMMRHSGNAIIGRKTFDEMRMAGSMTFFEGVRIVVVSAATAEHEGITSATSSEEAVNALQQKGHDSALVLGGVTLLNSFAAQDLADELILVLSPEMGGSGPQVLLPSGVRKDLRLMSVTELGSGVVKLHYALR